MLSSIHCIRTSSFTVVLKTRISMRKAARRVDGGAGAGRNLADPHLRHDGVLPAFVFLVQREGHERDAPSRLFGKDLPLFGEGGGEFGIDGRGNVVIKKRNGLLIEVADGPAKVVVGGSFVGFLFGQDVVLIDIFRRFGRAFLGSLVEDMKETTATNIS